MDLPSLQIKRRIAFAVGCSFTEARVDGLFNNNNNNEKEVYLVSNSLRPQKIESYQ